MADLENPGVPKFEKINSNKLYEALETIAELEKKRDESEKRGSELAASYCDGVIGDEYGRPHCRYKVERDAALAEVERNKLTIAAMNEAHAKLAADLEAVQARVAELEKQEPAGWLDLLTQPGLLNRVQRSPALWEISQQGEDLLGLDVPEIEVPDSMIEKAWQRFERTLQQLETPGQAEQAEQADNDVELDMKLVERLQVDLASKGDGVHMPLMTVAQHERISAQLHDALDECDGDRWKLRSERDAALARVAELEAALSSALSQHGIKFMDPPDGGDTPLIEQVCRMSQALAELEKQESVAWVEVIDRDYGPYKFYGKRLLPKGKHQLYAAPVAQAQHSVPEVSGIGRDFAYPRSVVLYLRTEPTDDDLRAIHDVLLSLAALSAQQSAQPEFCCKHSYKVAKQAAWGARDLTQCKCDHNEYCEHCWPDDFREGGKWHG
ncbi:hypothetical protein [Pseudomonas phage R12]|uniref:Uncharacterized protein n=1 Tax=Pseudomonas phage R12 TaxID=2562635 RepID=A0A455XAS2_9CAUD|nr:hypothetical protein HWB17_gp35 [Pseudomonas phage R12]BBJ26645.1 hypothetical protein [Pseudomonas phage R12]